MWHGEQYCLCVIVDRMEHALQIHEFARSLSPEVVPLRLDQQVLQVLAGIFKLVQSRVKVMICHHRELNSMLSGGIV